jgi:hypothetical protein
MPTQFDIGFLAGLLIGEAHFGGDGRQPQVTLRMHVRHEAIFRWLEQKFPGGRLYGPYNHGGRHYLQWMARGTFLRDELVPILDRSLSPELDRHSYDRFQTMKARYPQLTPKGVAQGKPPVWPSPCASDLPDSSLSPPATRAGDDRSTGARPDSEVSPSPESFADIFSQLRECWPGQAPE